MTVKCGDLCNESFRIYQHGAECKDDAYIGKICCLKGAVFSYGKCIRSYFDKLRVEELKLHLLLTR